MKYVEDYPVKPLNPGTTRFAQSPDNNMVIYITGFRSNWRDACREAYSTVYKLGYKLEDIYVFNYQDKPPLLLADVMSHNAWFIGDFKILTELEKILEMEKLSR